MEKQEPKVSIVMPVRNGERYLADLIADVEKNLGIKDEIIVVNDGSNDNTGGLLNIWGNLDGRLRIINTKGVGIVKSLNIGIQESSNDLIARFDVDDRYSAKRIESQRKLFTASIGVIFSDYKFISETNKYLGTIPTALFHSPTVISLVKSQRTPHPSVMFRKDVFLECGGYLEEDFPAEDLSLWLRMSRSSQLIGIAEVNLKYRLNKNSISSRNRSLALNQKNNVLRKYGISGLEIQNCLDNWYQYSRAYEDTNLGNERKILFFMDLFSAIEKFGWNLEKNELEHIKKYILTNTSLLPNFLGLGYYKMKRTLKRVIS